MKILQLTDIHIGGEYDGKFKCKLNFMATLMDALRDEQRDCADENDRYDLIVITGDLADRDYLENYEWIKDILDRTGKNYVVLPGNHDNVTSMRHVFGEHTVPVEDYMVKYGMLFLNNRPDAAQLPKKVKGKPTVAFCHYPTAPVYHTFMRQYELPKMDIYAAQLAQYGIKDVFCGHFHWPSDVPAGYGTTSVRSGLLRKSNKEIPLPAVHVAPATQCQLDPNTSDCHPRMDILPGYMRINVSKNGSLIGKDVRSASPKHLEIATWVSLDLIDYKFKRIISDVRDWLYLLTHMSQEDCDSPVSFSELSDVLHTLLNLKDFTAKLEKHLAETNKEQSNEKI